MSSSKDSHSTSKSGKGQPLDVRVAAARALAAVLNEGQSLNQALPIFGAAVAPRDQGLLQELCYGSIRWQPRLQAIVTVLIDKPLKSKDSDIHALLLLGLYQLLFTRIPDHAAIGTCVEASKKLKKPWASRLLNGVLRNFQRGREALEQQLGEQLAYRYAHPPWLLSRLQQGWPEHWQELLDANNSHPPMTLRVNQRRVSRSTYLEALQAAGITAEPTRFSPDGVTLDAPLDVPALPGFAAGDCSVQDEAAQLAVDLLALQPGQRVLDACCAPGGKACHILEREPTVASLTGVDVDPDRLHRVEENLRRLDLAADLITADVGKPEAWWDGVGFDRVLLDAPCSGTGVIRRHPDIKLLRRPSDIVKLATLQLQLLKALWSTLKPGGRLVYATCSVMPEENEKVVLAFLDATEDARQEKITADWGLARPAGRQLFPQNGGHDGFFYAVLHKIDNS